MNKLSWVFFLTAVLAAFASLRNKPRQKLGVASASVLREINFGTGGIGATSARTVQNALSVLVSETNVRKEGKIRFKDPDFQTCNFLAFHGNFGDAIGPKVVRAVLEKHFNATADMKNYDLAKGGRPKKCLFSLGSVWHQSNPLFDACWGTGMSVWGWKYLKENTNWKNLTGDARMHVYATRGPKTLKLVEEELSYPLLKPDTFTFGDPALLMQRLWPELKSPVQDIDVCFVPHHNDMFGIAHVDGHLSNAHRKPEDQEWMQIWKTEEERKVHVLWPTDYDFKEMARKLTRCKLVVSSSLHGIIVSETYGIPARWVQFSGSKTAVTERHFKYNDYFLATGRKEDTNVSSIAEAVMLGGLSPIVFDFQKLEDSFPYDMFEVIYDN